MTTPEPKTDTELKIEFADQVAALMYSYPPRVVVSVFACLISEIMVMQVPKERYEFFLKDLVRDIHNILASSEAEIAMADVNNPGAIRETHRPDDA